MKKKKREKGDAPLALRGPLPWRPSFCFMNVGLFLLLRVVAEKMDGLEIMTWLKKGHR